jgi:hypothetical protein
VLPRAQLRGGEAAESFGVSEPFVEELAPSVRIVVASVDHIGSLVERGRQAPWTERGAATKTGGGIGEIQWNTPLVSKPA